ncbi:hypothetical protein [Actinomadura litoris]|uniref:hypothetical protein n=1 Tax=Actinomadura litoris TaxID=2678616 RepID=UPI001FA6D661|nr:hypothetical protein [Actinomadura litoris]
MKIAEVRELPEGTQLRTTRKEPVTLTGFVRSCVIVRHVDGATQEYRAASLHRVADMHPFVTRERAGLTGHTVTVERANRAAARLWAGIVSNWEALIGARAVVERQDGRLTKVCAVAGADGVGDEELEAAAQCIAGTYGARYAPAGS